MKRPVSAVGAASIAAGRASRRLLRSLSVLPSNDVADGAIATCQVAGQAAGEVALDQAAIDAATQLLRAEIADGAFELGLVNIRRCRW